MDIDKEFEAIDALLEKPVCYIAGGHSLYLYQPSMGTIYLVSEILEGVKGRWFDISKCNPASVMMFVDNNPRLSRRVVAVMSMEDRKSAMKEDALKAVLDVLEKVDNDDVCKLLLIASKWFSRAKELSRYYEIDRESEYRARVSRIKQEGENGSLFFGGKSVWGSTIDAVCKKYGWTLDYVMWGISSINLNMIMLDGIESVYLSKEERKKAHIPHDRNVINADDPENFKRIKDLFK